MRKPARTNRAATRRGNAAAGVRTDQRMIAKDSGSCPAAGSNRCPSRDPLHPQHAGNPGRRTRDYPDVARGRSK